MAKTHNFAKNRKPILLINFLTLARLNQTWERVWYDYGEFIFRQGPPEGSLRTLKKPLFCYYKINNIQEKNTKKSHQTAAVS